MTQLLYANHLTDVTDLTTTYEEYRAGFLAFALEKNKRSTPFIERAKALKVLAAKAKTPRELLDIEEIQDALLYASGISDKAKKFLNEGDKVESINNLIEKFLEPAGTEFLDELIYRFLLFQGDSLGGTMRNIAGALAQQKLTRAIISMLNILDIEYKWLDSRDKSMLNWMDAPEDDYEIEVFVKGLSWTVDKKERTLIYNVTVPLVRKNVDICLFDCNPMKYKKDKVHTDPEKYVLLGELKGGIDPAGADEHWKTANSALQRINTKFNEKSLTPHLVFVGAAIERSMADEIWTQLQNGTLANVANLTKSDQVSAVCRWLINI
ncbi:Type II restriction enzyme BsoBI [Lysinibacillus fusiformis ZB2]|nr:Type II restriction enzyme BsoBI [Lysinibacillus fusiformis ZB2]